MQGIGLRREEPIGLHVGSPPETADVVIVGAGIVGLSVAYSLSAAMPVLRIAVVEKEANIAQHQTGHNSGVIHSGIYYKPGSLKAITAARGREALREFCAENAVPIRTCGKLIVATNDDEVKRLNIIASNAAAGGVDFERLSPADIRAIEPHCVGEAALLAKGAGVVDFTQVASALASRISQDGVTISCDCALKYAKPIGKDVIVETTKGNIRARLLVNCAGLYSDTVARRAGLSLTDLRIVPFRGEFFSLRQDRSDLVRGLIYPVADPSLPFLGVHLHRTISGEVRAGPNAVIGLSREGYKWSRVDIGELAGLLGYPGFLRLISKHWRVGAREVYRSIFKRAFVRSVQRLVPEISSADLVPYSAGVRAQAVSRNGALVDGFLIREAPFAVHVLNAPSPAATSCLEIGKVVTQKVIAHLG